METGSIENKEKILDTGESKLIKLGVACQYPVNWGFERILRDLIQNFYDSIGYERFDSEFEYYLEREEWGRRSVTMKTKGHPFHYEWLIYIGGSTKTEDAAQYIGKYGEGFKIAMLSLLKLGITDITMHSQDWEISPCKYAELIDGAEVSMLGYTFRQVENDDVTSLTIRGIGSKYRCYLEEGLLHFFYPKNPLFGNKLCEGDGYVIFRGNGTRIPCRQNIDFSGILYLNNLARGRLPFPIFVSMSGDFSVTFDSRKRKTLDDYDVWELMYILAKRMSPEDSYRMLVLLDRYWNDLPRSGYDTRTWYYLICQLVRNVAKSEKTAQMFKEEYRDLAYIERKGSDRKQNQWIDQTTVWTRDLEVTQRLVNPVFRFLGAKSLVEEYKRTGSSGLCQPNEIQRKKIDLLFHIYETVLPAVLKTSHPQVLIGTKQEAAKDPLRYADSDFTKGEKKPHQRYVLRKMVLSESDFDEDAFEETLIRFLDVMLHAFGSDRSSRMNNYFTRVGMFLIEHAETIQQARTEWQSITSQSQGKQEQSEDIAC